MLGHLCAIGGEQLTVVNGKGNGGPLNEISSVETEDLTKSHVFLDRTNGDIYKYYKEQHRWKPYASTGLRERARGERPVGAIYTPLDPTHKLIERVIAKRHDELKARTRVKFLQHWSMRSIPRAMCRSCVVVFWAKSWMRFTLEGRKARLTPLSLSPMILLQTDIIPTHNVRDLDESAIKSCPNRCDIIAECEYGPVMIECRHLFATQFHVMPEKYPMTAQILKNFIREKWRLMQELEHLDVRGVDVLQSNEIPKTAPERASSASAKRASSARGGSLGFQAS